MPPHEENFKKVFIAELSLLVLFLVSSGIYALSVVPAHLETPIFAAITFLGLIPVAKSALESLRERRVNVDLLATIALLLSLIVQEWGSVLFINIMLTGARLLDLYTRRRVRTSLESLMKLKPSKARILREKKTEEVLLEHLQPEDLVVVNLGEQIPVDGQVFDGTASVDQSSLTGESVPVLRKKGDRVFSATVVVSGNLVVRTERVGAETTFERMIKLVESSQASKSRMKTLGERFASSYIIIMLIVSVAVYLLTFDQNLVLAIVLVVCADDIAIAIPLAYIASVGTAARKGIIIKGADFLERAANITTLIVDKTGTLTMGRLVVKKIYTFGNTPLKEALLVSGLTCKRSTHPVAQAILAYAENQGLACSNPDRFEEIEGRGICSSTDGKEVILGRSEYLSECGVVIPQEVAAAIAQEAARGNNTTLIAYNGKIVGLFALADEVRPTVKETILRLKKTGIMKTVMLTGDNQGVAKTIAQEVGVDTYYAGLLPEHKVAVLEKFLAPRTTVAMIGDGVNDAAVLARADIGIAMGGIGSDAAIDSANIVLMKDDFSKLLELRGLARKVINASYINFAIWGITNVIGLYLVFTHVLTPAGAAAYNFVTDFFPIANSLRLFRYRESVTN